jgi:hypothetical protein
MTTGAHSQADGQTNTRWRDPLTRPAARDHIAQVYQDEAFLIEAISHFVDSGLRQGDGVIVIATLPHWKAVALRLESEGCSPDAAARDGRLIVLDAEPMLAKLMAGDMPDRLAFEDVIGGLVRRMRQRISAVRAFGEMVDLLWRAGNREAALRLEAFWVELLRAHDISLFCAYSMNPLDAASYGGPLEAICKTHSHLIPARHYDRLDSAVHEASRSVLDSSLAGMLRAVAHIDRPATDMPFGQLVLLWLKSNMPITADRILARVRRIYRPA